MSTNSYTMATATQKLEMCEVCAANKAKYTCPKCEVRTCALSCVNIHKKELNCDGLRDKTKFIPLHAFTDLDLLSDYRLLEDIGRSVDNLKKNSSIRCTRFTQLPVRLQRLRNAAYQRKINLDFMPPNFSRCKENTTFLNWKSDELFWRVELIFPQAENIKWVIDRVIETRRLSLILEEILYSKDKPTEYTDDELSKLSVLQSKLKYYQSSGLTGLKALLMAEKVKKSGSRFYELDFTLSLQENLKHKRIIEFPIIYIVLKEHSDMFEIIDSDDEEFKFDQIRRDTKSKFPRNHENISNKRMKSEKDTSVNYFFNDDNSNSEDEKEKMDRRKSKQGLEIPEYDQLVKMNH